MSSIDSTSGVPPIDVSTMPAAVQKGGTKAEQLYSTALQFEQLLVEQLTQQMSSLTTDDSSSDDGSDDGSSSDSSSSDGTTSMYAQMLPGALAQGITNGGGIGLASQIYNSMAATQGLPTTTGSTE
jgi:Rod binding domain-containing protein